MRDRALKAQLPSPVVTIGLKETLQQFSTGTDDLQAHKLGWSECMLPHAEKLFILGALKSLCLNKGRNVTKTFN